MATDALQQNPGYVDGATMLVLDTKAPTPLAAQIETAIRRMRADPAMLVSIGSAGQALTRQLYAPERQIGQRQHILRAVATRLGLPLSTVENPAP
jgi:lipopolysaccharide transport system ATP-binding protein